MNYCSKTYYNPNPLASGVPPGNRIKQHMKNFEKFEQ